MVPLSLTYLHCLQHSLFEHLFNLYDLRVMVLVHCTSLMEIYLLMKFQVSSLNTFQVMLRTKFKNKNKENTPKV